MTKKYSYLFFDLDNTFWDVRKNQQCALTELFAAHKMDRYFDSFPTFYDTFIDINTQLWLDYRDGLIQRDTLRNDRFSKLLAHAGINDEKLTLQLSDSYLQITPHYNNLIPHSEEILAYLHEKYPLGLITNGFNEVQFNKIKYAGIDKYFKSVVTSEFAGVNKPNPAIFRYAMQQVGVTPDTSIMIGDDAYNDVFGASESGMDTVYFNLQETTCETPPTYEIRSLLELKNILQ